ncbi:serine hydrolase domain-containing protein [Tahibacter amnicola]|uniref:Beta-lactamase family protein n=1 Tax=Tahibacter amnicola TaxID=2976241 RepID=A0ABY6BAH4_9GAMM|nr:serine hydrolase domain-containing protein [Tahibacter amnicola]UXI66855.1 beta-lactamase family protein [Tahibacter amnicola]
MLSLLLASSAYLTAPVDVSPSRQVDAIVQQEMARQRVPGVVVAVLSKGREMKVGAYGLANVEHQVPTRRETVFQSGSVGKQFTAAAVMLLVQDGKLALGESVRHYLPDLGERWQPITLRHLLTHTSGLPDWDDARSVRLERGDFSEAALQGLIDELPLPHTPGERFEYSNPGYVLLGILISKVTGRFYGEFLRERIFTPMHMKTARIISEADIVPHRAAGYRFVGDDLKNQEWVSPSANTTADGSLYVTIDDLIAWDRGLNAREVLSESLLRTMWTTTLTTNGEDIHYGFGWFIDTFDGRRCVWHTGEWQGFTSAMLRYVDDGLTVIVLTNAAGGGGPDVVPGGDPERIATAIAKVYLPAAAAPDVP